MDRERQIQNRQHYNREILERLSTIIEQYPEQRFGQLITNYIFSDYQKRDIFYEESYETLQKTNKFIEGATQSETSDR